MSIRARRKQYQEKYQREFSYPWFMYCREPLEDIEGWSEMLNDTSGHQWHLHHRDEIKDGVVVSRDELKSRGVYYNLTADKLLFLTKSGHMSLHTSARTGELAPMHGRTGDQNPMYGHNKYDITEENLQELYVEQGLTQQEIAEKFDCTQALISWYLRKFGIRKQAV